MENNTQISRELQDYINLNLTMMSKEELEVLVLVLRGSQECDKVEKEYVKRFGGNEK